MLLIVPFLSLSTLASGGGGPAFAEGVNYIDVKPPLIVNYGGEAKMRYIKAEISIRTEDMHGATEITHHLPLIRDKLISILSQQTEESVATAEGKEKLRLFALAEINKALHAIDKAPEAEDKKKDKKEKDKKDKKKSDKDKKSKDKKSKSKDDDEEKSDEQDKHKDEHAGPASDLFFNNFVVQK
jgi:flagellar basal body-associated protein FliL